jgi:hypothetical protein
MRGFVDNVQKEIWANVLHFVFTGTPPTAAALATIASNIATSWTSHMAPECPTPTQLNEVTLTDQSSDTAAEGTWLGGNAGTRGDDSIAANGAVLISYPSTLRYKGGHPRNYLYVLGNADFAGATNWTPAATTEVQTHWQAFLNGCIGLNAGGTSITEFCTVRRIGKFLPNGGPPHYYLTTPLVNPIVISQALASPEIASQRRRIGRAADSGAALRTKLLSAGVTLTA